MLIHIPNTHIFPAIANNKLYMTTVVYWPVDLYNTIHYWIWLWYPLPYNASSFFSRWNNIIWRRKKHLGHRNLPTRLKQLSSVLTLCCSTHLSAVGKQWNDFPSRHLGKKKLIMQGGTSLPTWSVLIAVRMTSVSVRLPGGHRAAPVSHRPESVRRSDGRRPILMWLSHAFVFNGACIMARRRASIGRPPCDDRPILIRSQSDSFPAPTSGTILSET